MGTARSIGSSTLADDLQRHIGPMLRITVELEEDAKTPTGLKWTSSNGFHSSLEYPLLCGVRVVTGEDRPIDLILPWVKDFFGIAPQPKLLKRAGND